MKLLPVLVIFTKMATSTISFQGVLDSSGSCEFFFTPPSNVSGKNCYVEVKSFGLSWPTAPTGTNVYDTYLLESSWAQIQSLSVEPYGDGPLYSEVTATVATPVSFTATGTRITNKTTTTDTVTTTGATVNTSNAVVVASVTGVEVGMYLTGTGIPADTTVTAINTAGKILTLSNAATVTSTVDVTLTFYKKSVVMGVPDPLIVAGMKVTGTGIADGTVVTSSLNGGTNVTLSTYINGAGPALAFAANTLTNASSLTGVEVGDSVSGTGIPSGTVVTAVNTAGSTVTLSNFITASISAGTITFTQSQMTIPTTGLSVGMSVSGASIQDGTTITAIQEGTIYLSRPLSAATTASKYTFRMPLSQMTQKLRAPLASLSYRGDSQGAPVLVNIPNGPQSVTFSVSRLDRVAVTTPVYLLVLVTMVAANSRPAPLN